MNNSAIADSNLLVWPVHIHVYGRAQWHLGGPYSMICHKAHTHNTYYECNAATINTEKCLTTPYRFV